MFLREVRLENLPQTSDRYPYNLAALQRVVELRFRRPVTFFVGENGSGKSTLLEAIAIAAGFNPEGGSRGDMFASAKTESSLANHMKLAWLPRANRGFFLRAESFFNFANYIDEMEREDPTGYSAYGGKSLHARSHGESFLALFTHRFRGKGPALFLLDEPEAALSPARQLTLLRVINDLERTKLAQFIIATHSPILLGYPGGEIWNFDSTPLSRIRYEDTEHFAVTKQFLTDRDLVLTELFRDDDD